MNSNFWLERWAKNEIGFHQPAVNKYLQHYWPQMGIAADTAVFVPLCGKSLDMRWLRERGHPVLGIEIARDAVRDFFAEWGAEPTVERAGAFERWQARGVTLLCGDIFQLAPQDVAQVGAVFDRAALIALPAPMRASYAEKLRLLLPAHPPTLLITTDYPQAQMAGPPFAVDDREVHELFADRRIERLAEIDVTDLPENARFRQRGLTRLTERVYRIG